MKKLIIVILALFFSIFLILFKKPVLATSPQVVFYVSPTGDNSSPGSLDKPFKTLTKARDVIRTINKNMTGDIIVYLRGGIYTLTSPLSFNQNDSGTNGHNIIYQNYQQEIPVISGGKQITGWQQEGNKWKAYVGTDLNTRQLYVNGTRAIRARSTGGLPGAQITSTGYTTTDTSMQNWGNISDVEFVLSTENWMQGRCVVQNITGQSITMKSPCFGWSNAYTTKKPLVQWIENAYELMDSPGEWYLNRTSGWLYYIPQSGEDMSKADVVVPVLETLISGTGMPDNPLHNIQFQGIIFSYATWLGPDSDEGFPHLQAHLFVGPTINNFTAVPANITFSRVQSVHLERNIFIHLGGVGLSLHNGSQNNTIVGNHFSDISSTALAIGDIDKPKTTDDREITKNNQITNNYIHQAAVEYQGSVGLWLGYVQNTLISHNEIYDLPYSGISIGWGWGKDDPSVAKDNKIENNLIYDHCKVLGDCGGIYSLSAQPGNVYAKNVIMNQVRDYGAMYLDYGSRYITVDSNVIYGNHRSVFLDYTGENVLQNNYWQDRNPGPGGAADILVIPKEQKDHWGPDIFQNNHTINSLNEAPAEIITIAGPAPQGLSPIGTISAGTHIFTWDPIPGAKRYFLRVNDTIDPWPTITANDAYEDNLTTNSYTFTFKPGHTYNWWVHAGFDITGTNGPATHGSITASTLSSPLSTPTSVPQSRGDMNGDGKVDNADYQEFLKHMGNTTCGDKADFNGDCKVDIFDNNILVRNYGK